MTEPTVLVSSRDAAPVPAVADARKLTRLAFAAGWRVWTTYALAAVPEHRYLNGNLAKAAHRLESIAVRLARGDERGYAVWHNEDGTGWRFVSAWLGARQYGLRKLQKVVSGRPASWGSDAPAGSTGGEVQQITGSDLTPTPGAGDMR